MLHYRVIRTISYNYPVAMLCLYVAAAVLAFSLMFIFPPGTILLLWLGLASLGFVVIGAKILGALERWAARRILAAGQCPQCMHRMQSIRDETRPWKCEWCDRTFEPDGGVVDVRTVGAEPAGAH